LKAVKIPSIYRIYRKYLLILHGLGSVPFLNREINEYKI
jgi:hypothetical protein